MSLLVSCQAIAKAYGAAPLFENLSFGLFDGDRAGLVGPNGSGKSTLIKILAGIEAPDTGTVSLRRQVKLAYVAQHEEFAAGSSVEDALEHALVSEPLDDVERHQRIAVTLGKIGFADPSAAVETLSGGWRKRLAIACALVREPDVLLLDEPTNHLDLDGILWLERLLRAETFAWLVVSHDRAFLSNVANRILELNRRHPGGLLDSHGSYAEFLTRKAELLEAFERHEETLANRVRREIEWLKRGPKARTTKAQARIDEAERLQGELKDVRERGQVRTAAIDFTASDRKTRRLVVIEGLAKRFGERTILSGLDLTISAGMRLGLLGPNGSGKSTLLRIVAGEIAPDGGTCTRADDLRVVYFDQDREQLDPAVTLRRTLAPDGDQVIYRERPLHVATWAKRFLFGSEQLEMPVGRMSGGERARVLIARLMLRPADLLILDEPTNDLDLDTLEALEESLLEFAGALVLVTHDRFLFDRVSTTVLALDGQGGAERFADFAQWEAARRAADAAARAAASEDKAGAAAPRPGKAAAPASVRRLSYMEQREWEQMEERILAAESELERCQAAAADPAVASQADVVALRYRELQEAQEKVDQLYARWAELEEKGGARR
jgi:ATP-binding cassette subfamily F protein uup